MRSLLPTFFTPLSPPSLPSSLLPSLSNRGLPQHLTPNLLLPPASPLPSTTTCKWPSLPSLSSSPFEQSVSSSSSLSSLAPRSSQDTGHAASHPSSSPPSSPPSPSPSPA